MKRTAVRKNFTGKRCLGSPMGSSPHSYGKSLSGGGRRRPTTAESATMPAPAAAASRNRKRRATPPESIKYLRKIRT